MIRRQFYRILSFWAKSVFPLMGKKLHIEGKDLFKRKHKYILLANHSSMFDIIAIMAFYPDVSLFGHERLLRIPLLKQMLLMTDYIPMKVSNITNTRKMLTSLEERARNNTIAIFPEGTRTLDGKLKPKNRFYINFGSKLGVVIHPPIEGKSFVSASNDEIIKQVINTIESANEFNESNE